MGNGPKVKPHNDHVGYHGRPVGGPMAPRAPRDYHMPGSAGQGPGVKPHNDHGSYHGRPTPGAMAMKPPETYEHARMSPSWSTGKSMGKPTGKPPLGTSKAD